MADSASIIATCALRGYRIAVAESLTGGLLVAELIATPGASAVVSGGVVAYSTELKHTVLGVEASLLASRGPVDPDVAMEMAAGVRRLMAVDGAAATIGIATTGVAGPDEQDGHAVGTAYLGVAVEGRTEHVRLDLSGTREAIRRGVVAEALGALERVIATL